jgi:uncharacterized membrane protein
MSARTGVTVNRPREEVIGLWQSSEYRPEYVEEADAAVQFRDAPGDRGTEILVDLDEARRGGKLAEMVKKLTGTDPLARVKDDLRRFKQQVETGEIPRSDSTPEGELAARKLRQRPAQPMEQSEQHRVGAS